VSARGQTDGLIARDRALVFVVDLQEAFAKAIPGFERIARGAAALVSGAAEMDVPVVATEQYPKGLGATVGPVAAALGSNAPIEKTRFSAARAEGVDLSDRDQVILCGVEAHVCVAQTALELLSRGSEVYVAEDAVGSRSEQDRSVGLRRMEAAGALPTSVEAALFELLGDAAADEFKSVQGIVLDYAPSGSGATA